jgi:hypothetical protein
VPKNIRSMTIWSLSAAFRSSSVVGEFFSSFFASSLLLVFGMADDDSSMSDMVLKPSRCITASIAEADCRVSAVVVVACVAACGKFPERALKPSSFMTELMTGVA